MNNECVPSRDIRSTVNAQADYTVMLVILSVTLYFSRSNQNPYLETFMESRNLFREMNSARQARNLFLGSLKGLQIRAQHRDTRVYLCRL